MNPLRIEGLSKIYPTAGSDVRALDQIDLTVSAGDFVAIMGASGSGKSTLLHLMAGLAKPDTGHVYVEDRDLNTMADRVLTQFRAQHIGLIFQAFHLIPALSARENVALPMRLLGQRSTEALQSADDWLDRVGLSARREHRPDAMSGGEQQRVAIARALAPKPAIVLADEPTGNLDSVAGQSICDLLRALNTDHQVTIAMVTHEPEVARHARRVVVLRDGRMVDQFETEGLADAASLAMRYRRAIHGADAC